MRTWNKKQSRTVQSTPGSQQLPQTVQIQRCGSSPVQQHCPSRLLRWWTVVPHAWQLLLPSWLRSAITGGWSWFTRITDMLKIYKHILQHVSFYYLRFLFIWIIKNVYKISSFTRPLAYYPLKSYLLITMTKNKPLYYLSQRFRWGDIS